MSEIILTRAWAMPNKWTFAILPIKNLLEQEMDTSLLWIDPFAGENSPARLRNDIREDANADYNLDALDFLKSFTNDSIDGVLFDPPYSVEQCLRRYTPRQKGTAGRAEYWARCKDEIKRIVKYKGKVISFCWDSCGCGKNRGFAISKILLVCHGACHNDTICTVEIKVN